MMENYDIYQIIKEGDESKIKTIVRRMLRAVINGTEDKNALSYFPSYFITVPRELGLNENYKFKDPDLESAIDIIANFEGDTIQEAIRKSKEILRKMK
jgi:hypothetical protein